jgi:glycosyltransferase involved in cell wall biosynthesis
MSIRTVVVCEAQVPFVRGGAEFMVRETVRAFREHGYETELVSLPFKWYPKEEILAHAAAWRLLDLSSSNGRPIDLLVGTKFPTYFARHPNKVTWLMHQYRAAYELCGTVYSDFAHVEQDVGLRQRLMELDRAMLGEARGVFAISRNVADRLRAHNGMEAEPLYHPPRLAGRLAPGVFGDYVLTVARIESVKRVDLVVRAMAHVRPPLRLVVVGEGTQRMVAERAAEAGGVADRVAFVGSVDDDQILELYAGALAVLYAPFDEDFGYVTLEAFLSGKPVVTTSDAGGPLEFVAHDANGFVTSPDPEALAEAVNRLARDRARAASLGDAGLQLARGITWDGVVDRLVAAASPARSVASSARREA